MTTEYMQYIFKGSKAQFSLLNNIGFQGAFQPLKISELNVFNNKNVLKC
jgi:hypothetical protein